MIVFVDKRQLIEWVLFAFIFSIAIIRQYAERRKKLSLASDPSKPPTGLKILEAFSASGLRSIRYAKEIVSLDESAEKLIDEIVANDISKRAVERIQFNIEKNGVGDIVRANHAGKKDVYVGKTGFLGLVVFHFGSSCSLTS